MKIKTKTKSKTTHHPALHPRLRIMLDDVIALGPGKVELLELVHETGSITQAAQRMGMSYMRAWTLIRTMNECFRGPLVSAVRGGSQGGGGAELTAMGRQTLDLYRAMNRVCLESNIENWKQLRELLKR